MGILGSAAGLLTLVLVEAACTSLSDRLYCRGERFDAAAPVTTCICRTVVWLCAPSPVWVPATAAALLQEGRPSLGTVWFASDRGPQWCCTLLRTLHASCTGPCCRVLRALCSRSCTMPGADRDHAAGGVDLPDAICSLLQQVRTLCLCLLLQQVLPTLPAHAGPSRHAGTGAPIRSLGLHSQGN